MKKAEKSTAIFNSYKRKIIFALTPKFTLLKFKVVDEKT